MTDKMKSRFKDASWCTQDKVYTLIGGAGGIGSWLALFLTRAGFEVTIYDYDTIEMVNMAGQFFSKDYVGSKKVNAVKALVSQFSDSSIYVQDKKYDADCLTSKFTFSGFDNMEAREIMFEKWYNAYKNDPDALFIDGRLTMEQLQIFCVKPHLADEYRKELFKDEEVEDTVCSMKQTSHTAAMIAGQMTAFFTNHISNINTGARDRSVPYAWEYYSPIDLHTKTEKENE